MYNGYDFLNLNTVGIRWQTFADGKQVNAGEARLDAAPHATAVLDVNTKKADYLWLSFTDAAGHELGRRSIELRQTAHPKHKVTLTIDPKTGLPRGFRPTVWHKLNDGDQIIKNRKLANNPEKYTVSVDKIETDGSVTRSSVHYVINDSNSIDARYTITTEKHAVTIDYEITPRLQTSYVPIVGLAYKMQQPKSLGRWYGLGPGEAYPNKQAAELIGLWDARGVSGTRRMQWVEVDGLHLCCDGYLDRDDAQAAEIRLLSHVLGRSEKGRLNYPEYQLPQGRTYKGRVVVR